MAIEGSAQHVCALKQSGTAALPSLKETAALFLSLKSFFLRGMIKRCLKTCARMLHPCLNATQLPNRNGKYFCAIRM